VREAKTSTGVLMSHEFKHLIELPHSTLGIILGVGFATGIAVVVVLLLLHRRRRSQGGGRGMDKPRRAGATKRRGKRRRIRLGRDRGSP
jgi:hypothetical protein